MFRVFRIGIVLLLTAFLAAAGCSRPQTGEGQATVVSKPTPSSEPTAISEFIPTVTPEPTPAPTQEPITLSTIQSGAFDSYYNDTVFIGDSLTYMLHHYVLRLRRENPGLLGEAQFMGTSAMSARLACQVDKAPGKICFLVKGQPVTVTEGINALDAKKAFIMLGLNDFGSKNSDAVEPHFVTLLEAIHEQCPDVQIVVQGLLPVGVELCSRYGISSREWNDYNQTLQKVCREHDAEFFSFANLLMDDNGYLRSDLGGDYHLSYAGADIWIRSLQLYAAQKLCPEAQVLVTSKQIQTGVQ